jgi:hypothetical protein
MLQIMGDAKNKCMSAKDREAQRLEKKKSKKLLWQVKKQGTNDGTC